MTFGQYPQVSLKEARDTLFEARRSLERGINPVQEKKTAEDAEKSVAHNLFEFVAREWFENKKTIIKDNYSSRIMGRLERDLFPFLSNRPIGEITPPELLEILRNMEARGAVDTAIGASSIVARFSVTLSLLVELPTIYRLI
jgi:hypothetical protein